MSRSSAFAVLIVLFVVVALGFRLPYLNNRPMHADEAVHTVKFSELWKTGRYHYDYNEFHGPTIYYATLPVVGLRGRRDYVATRESDYRLPIALVGAAMLLWIWGIRDGLGRRAGCIAASLFAVSPAFVFYSRYYIQEIFLAFFTLGLLTCLWQFLQKPSPRAAICGGVCAGLMVASKETAVLTLFVIVVAACLTTLWARKTNTTIVNAPLATYRANIGLAMVTMILVACIVLSGFGSHLLAPVDYLRSFTPWLHRAHGTNIHQHSWEYYLRMLLWPASESKFPLTSELLIFCLANMGALFTFIRPKRLPIGVPPYLGIFLTFYTFLLLGIYSAIPYKTPWCVLSFWLGMILLAGIGAISLIDRFSSSIAKGIVFLLILLGIGHLGWQSYVSSFVAFSDKGNPYAYSPTARETVELSERLEGITQASPQRDTVAIKVFSNDGYYWPLPWYLRRFSNIGYWTGIPEDIQAPLILSSSEFDESLTKRLSDTHLMTGYFALRPGVLMQIWVRLDIWQEYLKTHRPKDDDE